MPFIIFIAIAVVVWKEAPWIYGAIAACSATYWYWSYSTNTKRLEERAVEKRCDDELKNKLTPARREILKEFFNLSYEESIFAKFDGLNFQHRAAIPMSEYQSVEILGSENVAVQDRSLPHIVGWTFQRVDGGPDRRFNGNKEILTSRRHTLSFHGQKNFLVFFYTDPRLDPDLSFVDRLNDLLRFSRECNYANILLELEVATTNLNDTSKKISVETDSQRECRQIISAISELKSLSVDTEPMSEKLSCAEDRLSKSKERVANLELEMARCKISQQKLRVSLRNAVNEVKLKNKIAQLSLSANVAQNNTVQDFTQSS